MLARALVGLSDGLDRLCRIAASAAFVLMIVLIIIQVVARYLLANPPAWTDEGARYAMVWGGLLGIAIAFRAGADPILMRLEMFNVGFMRMVGGLLRAISTLIFLGPVWWYCMFGPGMTFARGYLARTALRDTETLGVPLVFVTASLPIAITIVFIHLAASALRPPEAEQPRPEL